MSGGVVVLAWEPKNISSALRGRLETAQLDRFLILSSGPLQECLLWRGVDDEQPLRISKFANNCCHSARTMQFSSPTYGRTPLLIQQDLRFTRCKRQVMASLIRRRRFDLAACGSGKAWNGSLNNWAWGEGYLWANTSLRLHTMRAW